MKQTKILEKLSTLELMFQQAETPLSFIEACKYLNISKSHLYKLTHRKEITHFKPNGKMIYFRKADLNNWLFRNKRISNADLEQKAIDYTIERGS